MSDYKLKWKEGTQGVCWVRPKFGGFMMTKRGLSSQEWSTD